MFAFILALIISKESFVQSISLGHQTGTAKKASAVKVQNCGSGKSVGASAAGEAGAQKPFTGSAVEKGSPELHWSSATYPERRRLRGGLHFFWIRNVFY